MARGGKRAGAGRWPMGHAKPLHRKREVVDPRHPIHVTMRMRDGVCDLRTRKRYAVIRSVMLRYMGLADFRICHFTIQETRLHMIVEASDTAALIKRMRSFTINCARAINRESKTIGRVF